jgi:hypothetical protein
MDGITRYTQTTVALSKKVLLETFALLKKFEKHMVLVGGWVPFLLLEKYNTSTPEFNHIGSVDIDIALNHKTIPNLDEVYESMRAKLEKNGFTVYENADGRPVPYRFKKEIDDEYIILDLLASEYQGTGKRHRHQKVQDVLARKTRGIEMSFQNFERYRLKGTLLDNSIYQMNINISAAVPIIIMKSIAFSDDINRTKDTYDIYSLMKYYKNGIQNIVEETSPYIGTQLFNAAMDALTDLFASVDHVGPVRFASFIEPENIGSETWEYYRRDIFENIQNFLSQLKD